MNDAAPPDARDRLASIGASREHAFPQALRHTARVARLRRFLLWGAGGITVAVLIAVGVRSINFLPADLRFAHIGLKGSRITIEEPKLVGYRSDGRPYELRAKVGVQDMTTTNLFDLEGINVRMENGTDNVVTLTAVKGTYDSKVDSARLSEGVRIFDDRNYDMAMQSATMDFKASVMRSDQPVTVKLRGGTVAAKSVEFVQQERRATFIGEVHSVLDGENEEGAPEPATTAPEPSAATPSEPSINDSFKVGK